MDTCKNCSGFLPESWDTCKLCGHDPAATAVNNGTPMPESLSAMADEIEAKAAKSKQRNAKSSMSSLPLTKIAAGIAALLVVVIAAATLFGGNAKQQETVGGAAVGSIGHLCESEGAVPVDNAIAFDPATSTPIAMVVEHQFNEWTPTLVTSESDTVLTSPNEPVGLVACFVLTADETAVEVCRFEDGVQGNLMGATWRLDVREAATGTVLHTEPDWKSSNTSCPGGVYSRDGATVTLDAQVNRDRAQFVLGHLAEPNGVAALAQANAEAEATLSVERAEIATSINAICDGSLANLDGAAVYTGRGAQSLVIADQRNNQMFSPAVVDPEFALMADNFSMAGEQLETAQVVLCLTDVPEPFLQPMTCAGIDVVLASHDLSVRLVAIDDGEVLWEATVDAPAPTECPDAFNPFGPTIIPWETPVRAIGQKVQEFVL